LGKYPKLVFENRIYNWSINTIFKDCIKRIIFNFNTI